VAEYGGRALRQRHRHEAIAFTISALATVQAVIDTRTANLATAGAVRGRERTDVSVVGRRKLPNHAPRGRVLLSGHESGQYRSHGLA
jgi:hypothetical protein